MPRIVLWGVGLICCLVPLSDAGCPNLCNQNGICTVDSTCTCFEGYHAPDCSASEL